MSIFIFFLFVTRPHCERYVQQALRKHSLQQSRNIISKSHALLKAPSSSQSPILLISERGFWRFYHAHKNRSSRYLLSSRGHLLVPSNRHNIVTWTRITKALIRPRNIIITGLVGTGAVISQVTTITPQLMSLSLPYTLILWDLASVKWNHLFRHIAFSYSVYIHFINSLSLVSPYTWIKSLAFCSYVFFPVLTL